MSFGFTQSIGWHDVAGISMPGYHTYWLGRMKSVAVGTGMTS